MTEQDRVIEAVSCALAPGGRLAILDCKEPERLPQWLLKFILRLGRPFGFSREYLRGKPWSLEDHFEEVSFQAAFGGMLYIAPGTKPE